MRRGRGRGMVSCELVGWGIENRWCKGKSKVPQSYKVTLFFSTFALPAAAEKSPCKTYESLMFLFSTPS